ncbi:MAG: N-acetylmuramoyl-L-alanine amidase [Proteobacteria bacterium]|nr:N-acetylmuramoyl-L-alanine amidase [Pseudomonadota bacterium]
MRHTLLQLLASILLCNTLISTTLSADESGNYVESTNYQVIKNKSLIEITFSQRTNYKHDQLQNPYRIYFDMEVKDIDKKLIALIDAINKQTGLITKAVIAKNKPDIVRIVFQFTRGTNTRISGDNKGIKIIASQSEIPDLIDNFYQAEATQTKNKIWEKEKYVIAIDAGHGGKDPGAVGRKGTTEKSVNLSIARRLKKLIDKEKNMQAVLTRNNDVYVKLSDRIKKIRKYKPNIFISIHADAAENRKASGSSVFIWDEVASSRYAQLIAEKENEMDLLFDPDIDNRDEDTQKTILDLTQNVTRYLSEQLGTGVLRHLGKVNNLHKKKVEKANFAVLQSIDVCSILVETAFLSNSQEEKQLKTAEYQDRLALAILQGIKEFLKNTPPEQLGVKISQH